MVGSVATRKSEYRNKAVSSMGSNKFFQIRISNVQNKTMSTVPGGRADIAAI
jgi:hypothetical protein